MLVTVVTLVTIENVYHMIITSVDDSIIFGNCGNLNPGELQCEEITLVFDGGTRLTTFPELRASPQFWKTAEEEVFS